MAGSTLPSLLEGVHTYIFLQPATFAGIACISNELSRGADPPGTYKPTLSIGLDSDHREIPLVVSFAGSCNDLNCLFE